MKATVGQYFFRRHYGNWGIWQYTQVNEIGTTASHIKDVFGFEDAVREVYRLNGWGEPKSIHRSF